jgi:hypothetical protein
MNRRVVIGACENSLGQCGLKDGFVPNRKQQWLPPLPSIASCSFLPFLLATNDHPIQKVSRITGTGAGKANLTECLCLLLLK